MLKRILKLNEGGVEHRGRKEESYEEGDQAFEGII